MQSVEVRTAQNVHIRYDAASVGDRIVAFILDSIILLAAFMIFSGVLTSIGDEMGIAGTVLIFLPFLLYHLLMEVFFNGQSVGKKALGIKVVKVDGSRPSLGAYLIRWIFRILEISFSSGLIAVLVVLVNGKGQRLGDIAAGTTVVKLRAPKRVSRHALVSNAPESYSATYAGVTRLSDNDIAIILEVLATYRKTANKQPLVAAETKVKEILGIQSSQPTVQFLYTIVKDYNHLTSQM